MDERSPLLAFTGNEPSIANSELGDHHTQFCHLVGIRPVNHPAGEPHTPRPESLYKRVVKRRNGQHCTYMFTAALVNTLLLSQIVIGAALTGLGASNSSRVLITIFGALNTVIAGVIAFLKSRGQPLRARMFRDDLERVIDEVENSAVMWFGISRGAHGYEAIDTDDQVTVRGEVARLTRLYDKAVKTNTMNDPDMYSAGTSDSYMAGLRKSGGGGGGGGAGAPGIPAINTSIVPGIMPPVEPPAPVDADQGPASKAPEPKEDDAPAAAADEAPKDESAGEAKDADAKAEAAPVDAPKEEKGKTAATTAAAAASVPPTSTAADPDESPASAAHPPTRENSKTASNRSSPTLRESFPTA